MAGSRRTEIASALLCSRMLSKSAKGCRSRLGFNALSPLAAMAARVQPSATGGIERVESWVNMVSCRAVGMSMRSRHKVVLMKDDTDQQRLLVHVGLAAGVFGCPGTGDG